MADTLIWDATGVEIHQVVVGPVDNNVLVLRCTETGDAVLLDAANEHELLLELCRSLGVRRVLETHGHWDHIQAVPELRDAGYSRSEEHTSELQSLMRISYAVSCLKKKIHNNTQHQNHARVQR